LDYLSIALNLGVSFRLVSTDSEHHRLGRGGDWEMGRLGEGEVGEVGEVGEDWN